MAARFSAWVIKLRWHILIFYALLLGGSTYLLMGIQIDPDIKSLLPHDMASRINIEKVQKIFGGTDMIMMVLSDDDVLSEHALSRLKTLSSRAEKVPGIKRALSLFSLKDIRSDNGELIVKPAVSAIPTSVAKRERLRETLKKNELVFGNVISKDFKASAVIGLLQGNADDATVVQALNQIVADVPGPEKVEIAGMPYVRVQISKDILHDLIVFLPIGLIICLTFLAFCFKQVRAIALPFVIVIMTILFVMGLIPLLGWKIQIVTVLLPIIVISTANAYGIHLMTRYQEENGPGVLLNAVELVQRVVEEMFWPIVFAGVTSIVGLMSLCSHIIVPAAQLGYLGSAGVTFALLASMTFLPALLSLLPRPKPVLNLSNSETSGGPLDRMLAHIADGVVKHPMAMLVVTPIAAALLGLGIFFIQVDANPLNYYPVNSPVRKSTEMIDRYFGGSSNISIVAKGDTKDPQLLKQLDEFEKALAARPEVGQTTSVAQVIRRMNTVLDDTSENPDRIPDNADTVAQYYLLYSMSGSPEDFESLVTFNQDHALLTARLKNMNNDQARDFMKFVHTEREKRGLALFPVAGGLVEVSLGLLDAVVNGQVASLILSLGLVALLAMWLFRSLTAGIVTVVPMAVSLLMLFGLMGIFQIELNIATAMLSSIMIGEGVDFAMHFLWRYREEREKGKDPIQAVRITVITTCRANIFNALAVIGGFLVVFCSSFMVVRYYGFLVVASMGSCILCTMLLMPAICLIFKPRFLEVIRLPETITVNA